MKLPGSILALLAILAVAPAPGQELDRVPEPTQGGDGLRSCLQWELRHAFGISKPILVLMANETWPEDHREKDPDSRARIEDLRGELTPIAVWRKIVASPRSIPPSMT